MLIKRAINKQIITPAILIISIGIAIKRISTYIPSLLFPIYKIFCSSAIFWCATIVKHNIQKWKIFVQINIILFALLKYETWAKKVGR